MKIETKYDIGQEVWFVSGLHYIKGMIREIRINIFMNQCIIVYGIEFKNFVGYCQKEESDLSPTKEELLKSL